MTLNCIDFFSVTSDQGWEMTENFDDYYLAYVSEFFRVVIR